jgi:hypothetical protein
VKLDSSDIKSPKTKRDKHNNAQKTTSEKGRVLPVKIPLLHHLAQPIGGGQYSNYTRG